MCLILRGETAQAARPVFVRMKVLFLLPLKQGRVRVDRLTGVLEGAAGWTKGRQWLLNVGSAVVAALGRQVPLLLENADRVSRLHGRLGGEGRVV